MGAIRNAATVVRMAGSMALTASRGIVSITVHVIESVAAGDTRTKKTKFKWDHLLQKVGEGRTRALKIAGAEVRRESQRAMSLRAPLKTPRLVEVGTVNGQRLVALRRQVPKSDRVTSWKTGRHPKGFLRSDIQYDYDPSSDTVVVGPTKLPRLNRLQEIGGTVNLFFVRTGPQRKVPKKFSGGTIFGVQANRPVGEQSIRLGARRVKARRFMGRGLDRSLDKIPRAFKDQIVGP